MSWMGRIFDWIFFVAAGLTIAALSCGCSQDVSDVDAPARPRVEPITVPNTTASSQTLLEARTGFATTLLAGSPEFDDPAPEPPAGVFEHIRYPAETGALSAYVTPDPGDGKQHPAVVWAHGGFGGIDSWFWEPASRDNDQSAKAFREAGIVMMLPSWRGENDNPGDFELFYGEVNDVLSAGKFLESLSYVDPDRIYLAGHSTGGTLTLLAVTASNQFRAAFSFGGAPDVERVVSDGHGYGNTPFDYQSSRECRLRSAIEFTGSIRTPTFFFEGESSEGYCRDAREMESRAKQHDVPFTACIIQGGTHFDILAPMTEYVAAEIVADDGPECQISITNEKANQAYQQATEEYRARRASEVADLPVVELTPSAVKKVAETLQAKSLDPASIYFRVDRAPDWRIGFDTKFDPTNDVLIEQDALNIVVSRGSVERVRGFLIDYREQDGRGGFAFQDRYVEPDRQ